MKIQQVAIQLYTLRDFTKTAEDYARTLKKVREIGYEAIQISGTGPIPVSELRSIAEGEGLTICATHEPSQQILDNPEAIVERLQGLGTKYTAYPYPAGVDLSDREKVLKLAKDLDRAGAVLAKAGLVLTYHNHAHELYRHGEETVLDLLFKHTCPENLQGEIDTYWIQAGGGCSVDWCRRLQGRLPLLHLKDLKVGQDGTPVFGEIGSGNLNFPAIIQAAEASGCEWFIVEQDVAADPFASIAQSFDYIKSHLVS